MLAFKGDFVAALAFVSKLDEVDVKGVEPLGNVFEYYEGNELKMRGSNEFENTEHLHFT
jgi:Asp-tRNA(Asn)/Glu-tRNA(Gln) amidotransferase C subunit